MRLRLHIRNEEPMREDALRLYNDIAFGDEHGRPFHSPLPERWRTPHDRDRRQGIHVHRRIVPYDHPHIFIDMGDDNEKVCSYCSTLYRYNPSLKAEQTNPPGCVFHVKAA